MIPSNTVLAMAELSADAVFGKITQEKYLYYINESLAAGSKAAAEHAGKAVEELANSLGVQIVIEAKSARFGGVNMRAQAVTEMGNTTIHVYQDSINSLADNSAWETVPNLDYETALNTHLLHELFHVQEQNNNAYVSDTLEVVTTWKLFSYVNSSHVTRCSEIAAHSFAKTMLGLPWLPNFYDFIYLRNQKQLSESQFDDFFLRMQSLIELGEEKQNAEH